ncbi:MAG TPA: tail fiber domain-containing protein [Terriglobia bacterium]|nr:tail fiber domain-containing protein [Terriglobia bacterium]
MFCLNKPTLSSWRFLPAFFVLVFTAVPASLAAVTQDSSATQAASAAQPSSDSVVPRLIQFSGMVKDTEWKPATGSVGLTFSLYQFEEGGSPLWVETQTVQLDPQGHYTVFLGAASPAGLPLDVFTTGAGRWLGVQPALPGAGEQPRVLLVGVPYAFKAADAETLGGKPASAYVTTESLDASGTSTVSSSVATANGTATIAGGQNQQAAAAGLERKKASSSSPLTSCSSITADGTATANQVAKFTAACTVHQSLLFDNGTDVGVGTTTPGATLDVNGNISGRDNLGLPQTTKSTLGVITLGGSPFIHACCSGGNENTFVGANAGNFTTTGLRNTASGFEALRSNTAGQDNTATGVTALTANTGSFNTATGSGALSHNTTGDNNTASAVDALFFNTTGGENTASGASALDSNTTGSFNTASGNAALFSNTTGSFNSALGDGANVNSGNLTNATAIGANSLVSESNAIVLGCVSSSCASGTSQPNVGIGTNAPGAALDVVAPNQVGVFVRGPVTGVGAGLDFQTTGTGGLQWELLDTGNTAAQGANKLNIRNVNTGNDIFTILSNGQVGIETVIPDNTLTVNGSADKPGGGSWGTFSDGRLKTVEGQYGAGLDAILKLNPVRYRYKEQNAMGIKDAQEHVGFVAQEVEKVIPEAVSTNSRGYLLVNNDPILWTMLNAIKQQQAQIEALRRSLQEKEGQVQKLSEQSQPLQRLQHQVAGLEGRLVRVEVRSEDSLVGAAAVTGLTR